MRSRTVLLLGLLVTAAIGCASSTPRYTPGSPGQWGGQDARASHPWQPPPKPSSTAAPNLVDTALDTVDILIRPAPQRLH
jgi:hypothetical protein